MKTPSMRPLLCLFSLLALLFGTSSSLHAEERPTVRKLRNSQRLEQRIEKLEQQIERLQLELEKSRAALTANEPTQVSRRYQMLKTGQQLVILDTETGETRIVEPGAGRPVQNVEVGKALVVVTVLGRVTHETATEDPPNSANPAPKP